MSFQRYLATLLVTILLALSGLAAYAIPAQAVRQSQQASADSTYYLPLVFSTDRAFTGKVTLNGSAVSGVTLKMYSYLYGNTFEFASATTGSSGNYTFSKTPTFPLGSSTYFYVYYANDRSSALEYFRCNAVTNSAQPYTCNIDIGDMSLSAPGYSAHVSLPSTFAWQQKKTTTDHYFWKLYTQNTEGAYTQVATSPDLGYIGSYQVTSLPGITPEAPYYWSISIVRPDGYGRSNTFNQVYFHNRGN